MQVTELLYSSTNTYLIAGRNGLLLFDTGWAGTFRDFCREMGEKGIPVQEISYILISHFHPDHCGIAQQIADCGPVIAVMDVQKDFIHISDGIFRRDPRKTFRPIDDQKLRVVSLRDSRDFLNGPGIDGEIIATPGHSDDSISLCLDDGRFFVGDLNPLYELALHQGTQIGKSWEQLLARHPKTVYYGHARPADLAAQRTLPGDKEKETRDDRQGNTYAYENRHERENTCAYENMHERENTHEYLLVKRIMKYTDKGYSAEKIQKKTNAPAGWIQDVMRMYLTHQEISVQGILDRMEIRGR